MDYIKESLLDIDDLDSQVSYDSTEFKKYIKQFIKDNYGYVSYTISDKPDDDGKFIVDAKSNVSMVHWSKSTSLTNEYFKFGQVKGSFHCRGCKNLTSLEGAPEIVTGTFTCFGCNSLTSLEGAPKEVGGSFGCNDCESLISLEGAPEKVKFNFNCSGCKVQFTEKDVKKYTDVGKEIICQ